MRFLKINIFAIVVAMLFAQSCATDKTVDLREKDYGYVQFRLYKSASYNPATKTSRAELVDELEYLADACKIECNEIHHERNSSHTKYAGTISFAGCG